jgi:hypothetical protein
MVLETPCFIPLTIIPPPLHFSRKVAGRKSGCLILHQGTAARQTATKEDVFGQDLRDLQDKARRGTKTLHGLGSIGGNG